MTTLLGCKLLTDWKPLEELLEVIHTDQAAEHLFEERFPGMLSAVFNGIRYLNEKRLKADRVVYWNFRVQVWPQEGFDADPSTPVRVLPVDLSTDPNWETALNPQFTR